MVRSLEFIGFLNGFYLFRTVDPDDRPERVVTFLEHELPREIVEENTFRGCFALQPERYYTLPTEDE